MKEQLKGKWALVTGASSGMGLHYSIDLAKRGCNVLLVSNQKEQVEIAAQNIANEWGVKTIGLYKDLAQGDSANELYDFCTNNNIEVEVLINNAGIFFFRDIADKPMPVIETMLYLHVVTVTKLCKLFAEPMKSRKRGYILNMSSISAHTPYPGISLYTASKSYIRTFTKAYHYELKEHGIKVMVVCPGAVATDLYNLPKNLQQLGINIGVIYRPEKLTHRAINKLLKGKLEYIPGIINLLFKPIFAILPGCFKMWCRRKISKYQK